MATTSRTPEPVSEYVRMLMSEWEAAGKTLKDLAAAAGLGSSMPSQIKNRSSDVTNYSGPKLAKALEMTYPELVKRAYEWWAKSGGATAEPIDPHPERATAIAAARTMGATEADIRRVLEMHRGPGFEEMTSHEWLQVFLMHAFPGRRAREAAQAEAKSARSDKGKAARSRRDDATKAARDEKAAAAAPKRKRQKAS